MLILFLGTTRKHRISPMTIAMITEWKCRDQVTDQNMVAHNVTKHVMVAPTVWVSPLIITVELVTLTWFCFSRNSSWLWQWHFAELITVKKSWHSDWLGDGRKNFIKHVLVTPTVLSITFGYHNWVCDADMDFVSVRFLYDVDSDILQHCACVHCRAHVSVRYFVFNFFLSELLVGVFQNHIKYILRYL